MAPDDIKLLAELGGFVLTLGLILWRLAVATTKFELVGTQQALEIRELKLSVDKMETAISAIAVQDVKIVAMIERMNNMDKAINERFNKLEALVDDVRHGKQLVRPSNL